MSLFKSKITAVTHDGNFHADEVFACAAISIWAEKNNKRLKIIRSRKEEDRKMVDMVFDIGGVYNPDKNRFDHHQKGGAGLRDNGVPYATFGLVWKKYGEKICESREIADRIEKKLVMPIDAKDNGMDISKRIIQNLDEYTIKDVITSFRPAPGSPYSSYDKNFNCVLDIAKEVIQNEIVSIKNIVTGEAKVLEEIKKAQEPEILVLPEKLPWEEIVAGFKKIKFVVYSGICNEINWYAESGKDDTSDFSSDRVKFPASWRGLRDAELADVSGVSDAVFCVNNGWLAVAKTKEGAIGMANKALQNTQN